MNSVCIPARYKSLTSRRRSLTGQQEERECAALRERATRASAAAQALAPEIDRALTVARALRQTPVLRQTPTHTGSVYMPSGWMPPTSSNYSTSAAADTAQRAMDYCTNAIRNATHALHLLHDAINFSLSDLYPAHLHVEAANDMAQAAHRQLLKAQTLLNEAHQRRQTERAMLRGLQREDAALAVPVVASVPGIAVPDWPVPAQVQEAQP